jgi:dihydrofolate synthase/folylpolyglutamate synthase
MRFQTLDEWLLWQEQLHPTQIELGLARVAQVWRQLRPQGLGCPVVSVAGTNGKGSSVALLDAILRAAGYRIGCYTSPHLRRYNERVRIDAKEVSDQTLCQAFERVDQARGEVSLTYFEFGTLAALDVFCAASLDLVILEVGLGGRLDAVNLIDADVALVTGVDFDHMDWLGDDLASIAREKAGIFRPARPAVIAQADAPPALAAEAHRIAAEVFLAGCDFHAEAQSAQWSWHGPGHCRFGLPWPALRAAHQIDNAAAVLMVIECLAGRFPVDQRAVRSGLRQVRLDGRLQVIPGEVSLILDVAHNPQAMLGLAHDLTTLPSAGRLHAVFGCFADKDAVAMVRALAPLVAQWHLAAPASPRALPAADLAVIVQAADAAAVTRVYPSVAQALAGARQRALPGERVLVTGSFLMVAAALDDPLFIRDKALV